VQRLIEGFRRFRETYYREHRAVFDALAAHGQWPRAMVIGCADSRVDPQLIFGAAPGDVFVVRNVANLVPPYKPNADYHGTSAALEFAVNGLQVEHIVVLGHARCGGVGALLRGPAPDAGGDDFIGAWMSIAAPARERALAAGGPAEAVQRACEHEAIRVSLGNLMTFPWVRGRVERGALALHGWYFDLEAGDLLRLGAGGAFESATG
jgi:carbonic anhydrase